MKIFSIDLQHKNKEIILKIEKIVPLPRLSIKNMELCVYAVSQLEELSQELAISKKEFHFYVENTDDNNKTTAIEINDEAEDDLREIIIAKDPKRSLSRKDDPFVHEDSKNREFYAVHQIIINFPPNNLKAIYKLIKKIHSILEIEKDSLVILQEGSFDQYFPQLTSADIYTCFDNADSVFNIFDYKVYPSPISLQSYTQGKEELSSANITSYLTKKLLEVDPQYCFLEADKFLDPQFSSTEKEALLYKLMQTSNFEKDPSGLSALFKYLTELANCCFFAKCHGKEAHDKGQYNFRYTELNVLRDHLSLDSDGKAYVDLMNNFYFKTYYTRKKSPPLKEELLHLIPLLGLELDEISDFTNKIVFTKKSTELLFKHGLFYTPEYLLTFANQHQDQGKKKQQEFSLSDSAANNDIPEKSSSKSELCLRKTKYSDSNTLGLFFTKTEENFSSKEPGVYVGPVL